MIVARLAVLAFLIYIMRSIPYGPGMPAKEVLIIGLVTGTGLAILYSLIQDIMSLFRPNNAEERSDDP
ncbi:MAG: hypothetical protein WAU28_04310 [Candidatus Moraniibacteriota bacterium]